MSTASDNPGDPKQGDSSRKRHHPFRKAVLRGLGIVMPPLLTIVLFFWAWTIIERNVLTPVETGATKIYVWATTNDYAKTHATWLYDEDLAAKPPEQREQDVREHVFTRTRVLPAFLSVFILVLYLLGKFVAAPVGRMLVTSSEAVVGRLPLVSNVYASVKQVTDFFLSEQEIEFNRVVAVEYPRKGVWSVGFVTGESMLDIRSAANEPLLSVLMPTSPMPMTGFTITVRKNEVIDLNITVDQAIQFVVSCGVVVPPQQQQKPPSEVAVRISAAIAQHGGTNGEDQERKRSDERTDAIGSSGS
jgi:uncharacterized membrane protein